MKEREGTWSWEAREKPGGSGMSREEGEVELSLKSTAHLLPPTITPFPFSIFLDLIIDRSFSALLECPQQCPTLLYYYSSPFGVLFFQILCIVLGLFFSGLFTTSTRAKVIWIQLSWACSFLDQASNFWKIGSTTEVNAISMNLRRGHCNFLIYRPNIVCRSWLF